MSKTRGFCFTVCNPKASDFAKIYALAEDCEYLICGREIAPTTGTPHLQCYVYFKNPRSINGSYRFIPGNNEPSRGSPYQNYEYCAGLTPGKTPNEIMEWGKRPKGEGKRSDIQNVKDLVRSGASMLEVWDQCRSYQAFRMAEIGRNLIQQEAREKPTVLWYWGPTGSGKTRTAIERYPDAWISGKNLKWWLGYTGQPYVIIDDFRRDFCTFHELLRILDRYPYNVEVKGGHVPLQATVIIITCPDPPEKVFQTREDVRQLLRRIDEIVPFGPEQRSGEIIDPDLPIFDEKLLKILDER